MSRWVWIAFAALALVPFGSAADDPPARTSPFPTRTGPGRTIIVRVGGASAVSELAVGASLAWLAQQQAKDGGWQFEAGEWRDDRIAATGLALLPFLGSGETHKDGKHQKVVADGLAFLTKACPKDGPNVGTFGGAATATAQALAALALCEAYAMTKDEELKPFAQAAVVAIQKAQAADGGWSDAPGGKSDIAVVGWQVQALQAASMTKALKIDDKVGAKAIGFLRAVAAGPRKSMYGTTDNSDAKPGTAATATGLLCRYYIDGWGPGHPGMIEGVGGLLKNGPDGKGPLRDTLYFYYATQVVRNADEDDWRQTWNAASGDARKGGMRDWVVNAQVRKEGPNLGSWEAEGEWGKRVGRLGTTALNALTLEVYYRYPRLYEREGRGGAKILDDK